VSRVVRLRTNAKTNLLLRVLGRRSDGYHEIETVFHTLGLSDSVTIAPATSGEIEVHMHSETEMGGLPLATDNLVHAAARALWDRGGGSQGATIEIVKRIPIGAGLGGGSGNAAAALRCLNEIWGLHLPPEALANLGLGLGADVPYCLTGGTALAAGRGEVLTRIPAPATLWFVLGLSDEPLLTRAVYETFDSERNEADVRGAPMVLALELGDVGAIANLLHNDLELPAFRLRPELAKLKGVMLEAGALGAVMSGSGPTMVGLARDQGHASAVAGAVERYFDRVTVASSRPECIERLD
jgi:4-diphosphocytidyl-2-C-methyl-D-erythritol kinase